MVTVSRFYGITIKMWFDDHGEPHFHAEYGEYEFKLSILTLRIMKGRAPRRIERLVRDWAKFHRDSLLANWQRARRKEELEQIPPLP